MNQTSKPMIQQKKLLIFLGLIALGMFGFGYLLVPLYNVLCKTTGLNGKMYNRQNLQSAVKVDTSRTIRVQFLASTNNYLPWDFYPLTETITVHPGEIKRVDFFARNNTTKTMTVQAIPSVAPGLAARHLKKTECFCFNKQTFQSGQGEKMTVLFHVDTDLPENIKIVTLSYTMFDASQAAPTRNLPRGGHIY